MKKILLVLVASIAALNVAACAVGKGKGKTPPPVVTKGVVSKG
jgi:hypothetical protein